MSRALPQKHSPLNCRFAASGERFRVVRVVTSRQPESRGVHAFPPTRPIGLTCSPDPDPDSRHGRGRKRHRGCLSVFISGPPNGERRAVQPARHDLCAQAPPLWRHAARERRRTVDRLPRDGSRTVRARARHRSHPGGRASAWIFGTWARHDRADVTRPLGRPLLDRAAEMRAVPAACDDPCDRPRGFFAKPQHL